MPKKILVIEDDAFLGDVLLQKLTNEKFEAYLEKDGGQAIAKMREIKPDLVLLDIILPNKNGYEILEEKKASADIASIPVIIISNSGQPVEINRVMSLGVKSYLIKAQFDPEEVMEKVRNELSDGNKDGQVQQVPAENKEINLDGKKIMWVEDDKFLNDIIKRKLANTKATLIRATSAEEAFDLLSKETPDIIVLDILLSGMDGYEILRKIKSEEKTKNIPVVMLSNLGQQENIDKAKELGALKFFVKATVTLDEIVSEIAGIICKS